MPIRVYECQECNDSFESWERVHDPPLTECSACGKMGLIRIVQLPGRPKVSADYGQTMDAINKEIRETTQKIRSGDQATIADVFGEKAVK